jgi:hypothetical protein
MKHRFGLFAYDTYYPAGGFGDLIGTYATYEEAKAAEDELSYKWDTTEIVDFLEVAEHGL